MAEANKKATLYLQPQVLRAVKMMAARNDTTASAVVNATLKRSLERDLTDSTTFRGRAGGKTDDFEAWTAAFIKQYRPALEALSKK